MNNNDWTELGNSLREMVDEAVNSRDFKQLNENICRTVADGLDTLSDNIRKSFGTAEGREQNGFNGPTRQYGPTGPNGQNGRYGSTGQTGPNGRYGQFTGAAGGHAVHPGSYTERRRAEGSTGLSLKQNQLFTGTFGAQAGGTALSVVGYTGAGITATAVLIMGLVNLATGAWGGLITGSMGLLGAGCAGFSLMAWKGTSLLRKVKRFRQYVDGLKGRTYCSIKELAESVGKKEKYVRSDLQKLIRSGWFRQGHMDRLETCLIVSDNTYAQYEQSQKQLEQRQKEERERLEMVKKENEGLSAEVRQMISAGNEYIARIKKSNEGIPGEEISEKISRIQTIVEKIFQRVKEHPEYADDLSKFMDYYLPTTVKLLDAYEELDRQPVQGENIRNSKQEIEKSLDTLNQAFENLLDSLFEDTAWDVSTDISVLQTMLAQEGLTGGMKKE